MKQRQTVRGKKLPVSDIVKINSIFKITLPVIIYLFFNKLILLLAKLARIFHIQI